MKEIFAKLPNAQLLALALYGEARGESSEGKIAVASVILERVLRNGWFGKGLAGVVLKPFQFSCFNRSDPNCSKLLKIAENWDMAIALNPALNDCYTIAVGMLRGDIPPNIEATHYATVNCNAPWAGKLTKVATIGKHTFYI